LARGLFGRTLFIPFAAENEPEEKASSKGITPRKAVMKRKSASCTKKMILFWRKDSVKLLYAVLTITIIMFQ
jgi:hypothetical protein